MLRNQRVLTVKRDDGGPDGGVPVAEFVIDCSRFDIASKTNEVTIAVNRAALIKVKSRNTRLGKANPRKVGDCSCSSSTFLSFADHTHPRLSHTYTIWTEIERRLCLVEK